MSRPPFRNTPPKVVEMQGLNNILRRAAGLPTITESWQDPKSDDYDPRRVLRECPSLWAHDPDLK